MKCLLDHKASTKKFLGPNRQFDQLEISLVFHKSDNHLTICDSYNVEKAAQFIKSVELETISEAHSLINQRKYEVYNDTKKHILYKKIVARNCNGYSVAPITQFNLSRIA